MGDIADYTLELCEGGDLYWDDVMYMEEFDSFIGPGHHRPVTCRFCGKKNLAWGRIAERWVLCEDKGPHKCPKRSLPLEVLKEQARRTIEEQRNKK